MEGNENHSRLMADQVCGDQTTSWRAPEGSGVPVGTEYHWYVLAHQNTTKRTANDYATSLTGLKFKIAHKRAGSEKWSATPKPQRKRMIMFLEKVIADLKGKDTGDVTATGRKSASEARSTREARRTAKRGAPRRAS